MDTIILNETIFYRYDGYSKLIAKEYIAVKKTKYGYWIVPKSYRTDKPRLIYPGATASYAYLRKEDALISFMKRKHWQILHLSNQLNKAESALKQAEAGIVDEKAKCNHELSLDEGWLDL